MSRLRNSVVETDYGQHRAVRDGLSLEAFSEARWYAAQTCARHEKKVAAQMVFRGIESFLPLYETISRWRDRQVRLKLPLFAGYVFVRIACRDRLRVLEIPSVVRLVGFNGLPTAIPDQDIKTIQDGLNLGLHAEPLPYLRSGQRVKIGSGPLEGYEGTLLRRKGQYRFVLSITLIQRSVAVSIDAADLVPLPPSHNESSESARARA